MSARLTLPAFLGARSVPDWITAWREIEGEAELEIEDDGQALELALEEGVTSNPHGGSNMGLGLAELRRFSDRHDGELWIASGTALLRRRTVVANKRATTVHPIDCWQGSWICLEAPVGAPPSTLPRTESRIPTARVHIPDSPATP